MLDRGNSKTADLQSDGKAAQPSTTAAPAIGNRAMARAAEALQQRPNGRGLGGDRAQVARRVALTAERQQLQRLVHEVKTTQGEFKIDPYDTHEDNAGD